MQGLEFHRAELSSAAAAALIAALNAELSAVYPEPGATHFRLEAGEVLEGRGAFLVGYAGRRPLACGAVRRLDAETVEIKRMYVVPEERGRGIGRQLLRALESEARRLGALRIVLETGTRQAAARALYESVGFGPIPPYGEYVGSPVSVCMEKRL